MAKKRSNRRFNKRFELWQTSTVPEFGGGNTVADILITSSWCDIKTANANSNYRSTDNGITTATNQIVILTRKRNDITYNNVNQFIKYRGDKYIISNQPYETNFDNMYIELVCTKIADKNIQEITPI